MKIVQSVFILFISFSCVKKEYVQQKYVEGKFIHKYTGKPISKMRVNIGSYDDNYEHFKTGLLSDANGNWSLKIRNKDYNGSFYIKNLFNDGNKYYSNLYYKHYSGFLNINTFNIITLVPNGIMYWELDTLFQNMVDKNKYRICIKNPYKNDTIKKHTAYSDLEPYTIHPIKIMCFDTNSNLITEKSYELEAYENSWNNTSLIKPVAYKYLLSNDLSIKKIKLK